MVYSEYSKTIATSGFVTALEHTKFVFGPGSAPDLAGGAYSAPPDSLDGFRGLLLCGMRRAGKMERGGEQKRKGRGKKEREGSGPFRKFLDPPLVLVYI